MNYDVIIIGGSYAGLSAGMALGRSFRKVLIIDNGKPCNKKAPHSHNFLTNDGLQPSAIALKARQELAFYQTVNIITDTVIDVVKNNDRFEVITAEGNEFIAHKMLFATGIKDIMPAIPGFEECWGTSIIHCPYCHGYEVYQQKLAVFGNGDEGFEFAKLISNWSKHLTLFTNGASTLSLQQEQKLTEHGIEIIQTEITSIDHTSKQVKAIILADGVEHFTQAIFARVPFEQHTPIPENMGCALTKQGLIETDGFSATTLPGAYAAGDNASPLRSVANAVATGMIAGAFINKALIEMTF